MFLLFLFLSFLFHFIFLLQFLFCNLKLSPSFLFIFSFAPHISFYLFSYFIHFFSSSLFSSPCSSLFLFILLRLFYILFIHFFIFFSFSFFIHFFSLFPLYEYLACIYYPPFLDTLIFLLFFFSSFL